MDLLEGMKRFWQFEREQWSMPADLHWYLCSSPLDLEQREGRIQRFGSLSVRSALAQSSLQQVISDAHGRMSPWALLETRAN